MVRLHYEIPDDLHRKVKMTAAAAGITQKALLIRALERVVEEAESGPTLWQPGGERWSPKASPPSETAPPTEDQ